MFSRPIDESRWDHLDCSESEGLQSQSDKVLQTEAEEDDENYAAESEEELMQYDEELMRYDEDELMQDYGADYVDDVEKMMRKNKQRTDMIAGATTWKKMRRPKKRK